MYNRIVIFLSLLVFTLFTTTLYADENGRAIIFAQHGNLYLMSVDTTSEPELFLNGEGWYFQYPGWSPDGTQITFSAILPNYTAPAVNGEIFIVSADGSTLTQLTDNGANNIYPLWSPDGMQIAFTSDLDGDWEIYAINIDGSNLTQVTDNDVDDGGLDGFTWSPDSQYIAYVTDQGNRTEFDDGSFGVLSKNIYIVDTRDPSSVINLTQGINVNECGAGNFYRNPVWSHERNQLFFAFSCSYNWNIYSLDITSTLDSLGTPSYQGVTNDSDQLHGREGLDVSPDGSSLVFVSSNVWTPEQNAVVENIFVLDIGEVEMSMLTESDDELIDYTSPRWRPVPTG